MVDEALAVGDAFFHQKCMRFLRDFMKRGTILFVSHDTGAIVNRARRALWLQKGEVMLDGSPERMSWRCTCSIWPRMPTEARHPGLPQGNDAAEALNLLSFGKGGRPDYDRGPAGRRR